MPGPKMPRSDWCGRSLSAADSRAARGVLRRCAACSSGAVAALPLLSSSESLGAVAFVGGRRASRWPALVPAGSRASARSTPQARWPVSPIAASASRTAWPPRSSGRSTGPHAARGRPRWPTPWRASRPATMPARSSPGACRARPGSCPSPLVAGAGARRGAADPAARRRPAQLLRHVGGRRGEARRPRRTSSSTTERRSRPRGATCSSGPTCRSATVAPRSGGGGPSQAG